MICFIGRAVQGNNASLYVRPLLFASGQMLGLAPLAGEYTFFVTVLPAGGYFGKGSEVGVKASKAEELNVHTLSYFCSTHFKTLSKAFDDLRAMPSGVFEFLVGRALRFHGRL